MAARGRVRARRDERGTATAAPCRDLPLGGTLRTPPRVAPRPTATIRTECPATRKDSGRPAAMLTWTHVALTFTPVRRTAAATDREFSTNDRRGKDARHGNAPDGFCNRKAYAATAAVFARASGVTAIDCPVVGMTRHFSHAAVTSQLRKSSRTARQLSQHVRSLAARRPQASRGSRRAWHESRRPCQLASLSPPCLRARILSRGVRLQPDLASLATESVRVSRRAAP